MFYIHIRKKDCIDDSQTLRDRELEKRNALQESNKYLYNQLTYKHKST